MGIVHWYSKLIPPLCSIDLWWNKLICMLGMLHGHAALVKLYNNLNLWPSLISEKNDLILLFFLESRVALLVCVFKEIILEVAVLCRCIESNAWDQEEKPKST